MTETCEISTEYESIAKELIESRPELRWIDEADIRISYLTSDKLKISKGRTVYGECHKVKPMYQAYIPYDFIIVIYDAAEELSDDQKRILMLHELLHVGIDDKGDPKIVPHDVEDFTAILNEFGMDWCRLM